MKEPFVKEGGPLLRVQLLSKSAEEHYLLTVIHHIVFDGISSITFIHSLLDHYQALLEERRVYGRCSRHSSRFRGLGKAVFSG